MGGKNVSHIWCCSVSSDEREGRRGSTRGELSRFISNSCRMPYRSSCVKLSSQQRKKSPNTLWSKFYSEWVNLPDTLRDKSVFNLDGESAIAFSVCLCVHNKGQVEREVGRRWLFTGRLKISVLPKALEICPGILLRLLTDLSKSPPVDIVSLLQCNNYSSLPF